MSQREENRMGTVPMGKLLTTMSLPMMASMLVQALYNVVDSIFVAKLSSNALTAVSLAFPIQSMMIAVAVGTGVGVNALLARKLGEKKYEDANHVATNGLFLALISSVAFVLFGLFGVDAFFRAFTDDPVLMVMGRDYTFLCCIFSFGVFLSIIGERIMQASGNTFYSMVAQMAGAVTNIILDPLLIFGLLGFPRLEVKGAAIATIIGQMVSMCAIFYFNFAKNHEVTLSFRGFRPHTRIIGEIYRVGLPSIVMQSIGAFMALGMNKILMHYSVVAMTVMGIYFKLQSFVMMPIFGLTNAMVPIVSYNFGARHRARIVHAIRLSAICSVCIMGAGTILFQVGARSILEVLFDATPEMIAIGVPALRIISVHFMTGGVSIVLSSTFQALGNGVYSLILSFCRQILLILPVAWAMARFVGVGGVWWAFPIAEVFSLTMAVMMFRKIYGQKLKYLEAQ